MSTRPSSYLVGDDAEVVLDTLMVAAASVSRARPSQYRSQRRKGQDYKHPDACTGYNALGRTPRQRELFMFTSIRFDHWEGQPRRLRPGWSASNAARRTEFPGQAFAETMQVGRE